MEKRNICLIKVSGREILIDKNNKFLEFHEELNENQVIEFIRKNIKEEFEYSNIIFEEKRNLTYYEEAVTVYVINIDGAKVSSLKELKILNYKRDKIDSIYGNIIDNLYSTYKFYIGARAKKYTEETEKEKKINRLDIIFSIIIGFSIGIVLFLGTSINDAKIINVLGIGVTLLWFIIMAYILIVKRVNIENKFGAFLVVIGLILSICFTIFANEQLKFINFFLIPVLILFGSRLMIQKENDIEIFSFVIDAITFTFLKSFSKVPSIRVNINFGEKKGKTIRDIVVGIIIAIPIVLVLGKILSAANSSFEKLIGNLISFNFTLEYSTVLIVISGIFFSLYFIGMMKSLNTVYRNKKGKKINRNINFTILNTIITMVDLLYIIFVITAFLGEGKSYSEQARTGFFQLIFVVVINIAFIIYLTKIDFKKYTKYLLVLMLILSVFMGINSIKGLVSYIEAYGLTRLRFVSTLFSVFLITVLALLIINSFRKFKVWYLIISIGLIMYVGLNYCNMDNIIAKYNLSRMNMEKGYTISDLDYYTYLSKDCKNTLIEAKKKGIFEEKNYKGVRDDHTKYEFEYLNNNLNQIINVENENKWFEFNYYDN